MKYNIDWNDTADRGALLEHIGVEAYRAAQHSEASIIEVVNGYAIRSTACQFGTIFPVGATRVAGWSLDEARQIANELPPGPGSKTGKS